MRNFYYMVEAWAYFHVRPYRTYQDWLYHRWLRKNGVA
jgi:hypothetical protein